MSKPQVTITLGRSGQKVVKGPWAAFGTDSQQLSGRKRSVSDRFERDADTSMLSSGKRLRRNEIPSNGGSNRVKGARVGRNDLRLKLMHKRISRRNKHDVEESTEIEICQNMSSTIRAPKGPGQTLGHGFPTKRMCGSLMMDPMRSYSARPLDKSRPQSSDGVFNAPRKISPPRTTEEVWRVPSIMSIHASRTGRLSDRDVLDPSSPKGPAPISRRVALDAHKPLTELQSGEQPLTVDSLLHSLDLGKYAINFLAEEVDMTALKQMRDHDLKALGLPMGPRKKILLAILPRSKINSNCNFEMYSL